MLSEFRTYKYKINMNEHLHLALKTLTYTRHHGQKSQQQKHVARYWLSRPYNGARY